jgi:hypothetical protein
MEIKQRIEIAKVNLRKAENAKTVAETQKAQAEKQLAEVVEKMAAEGVTPETISDEIARLEGATEESLTKVEALIPRI